MEELIEKKTTSIQELTNVGSKNNNQDREKLSALQKKERRFGQFTQAYNKVEEQIFPYAYKPDPLEGMSPARIYELAHSISAPFHHEHAPLSGKYIESAIHGQIHTEVLREQRIGRWWRAHEFSDSTTQEQHKSPEEIEANKQFINELYKKRGLAIPENLEIIAEEITLQRVLGGVAVRHANTEILADLIVKGILLDGRRVENREAVLREITESEEFGFTVKAAKALQEEFLGSGLKDMNIIFVRGEDEVRIDRILDKEIKVQVFGNFLDELFRNRKLFHLYGRRFGRSDDKVPGSLNRKVATALHEMVACLRDGEGSTSYLAHFGIAKDYERQNPEGARLVGAIADEMHEQLSDNPMAAEEIARKIEAGIIQPEHALQLLRGTEEIGELSALTDEKIYGPQGKRRAAFLPRIEGRFISNKRTKIVGSKLHYENIPYVITQILGEGGFGAVSLADRINPKTNSAEGTYIIKELMALEDETKLAIFESQESISNFLTLMIEKNRDPKDKNKLPEFPAVVRDILDYFGRTEQDIIGKIFISKLAGTFGRSTTIKGAEEPLYRGDGNFLLQPNGNFAKFDSQTGQPLYTQQDFDDLRNLLLNLPGVKYDLYGDGSFMVSIKYLLGTVPESTESFLSEFGIDKRLYEAHIPNVAGAIGVATEYHQGHLCFYMVQQYAKGKSLEAVALTGGKPQWNLARVVQYGKSMLDTEQKFHNIDIIHKDIKDDNLIVADKDIDPAIAHEDEAVFIDFGISKENVEELNLAQSAGLRSGTKRVGTEGYVPPEQRAGMTDKRSDLYATAMVLYQLATGDDPRDLPSESDPARYDQMRKKLTITGAPQELSDIILRGADPDPNKRYQNATEFKTALEKIRIVTKDQELDEDFAELKNQYYQFRAVESLDKLPPEFKSYLDKIQKRVSSSPNDPAVLEDAFRRLGEFYGFNWRKGEETYWNRNTRRYESEWQQRQNSYDFEKYNTKYEPFAGDYAKMAALECMLNIMQARFNNTKTFDNKHIDICDNLLLDIEKTDAHKKISLNGLSDVRQNFFSFINFIAAQDSTNVNPLLNLLSQNIIISRENYLNLGHDNARYSADTMRDILFHYMSSEKIIGLVNQNYFDFYENFLCGNETAPYNNSSSKVPKSFEKYFAQLNQTAKLPGRKDWVIDRLTKLQSKKWWKTEVGLEVTKKAQAMIDELNPPPRRVV